ncbi:MAG: hypothetical protein ACFB12_17370 [Leptolyngbyaceae cyanobacterium]
MVILKRSTAPNLAPAARLLPFLAGRSPRQALPVRCLQDRQRLSIYVSPDHFPGCRDRG